MDATVVLHFDEAQSKESAESFIDRVLIANLAVKIVVVGEDFHFGSHREGNVRLLGEFGRSHDFVLQPVHLVERVDGVEEPISSTAIRLALAAVTSTWPRGMLCARHEVAGKVGMAPSRPAAGFRTPTSRSPIGVMPADSSTPVGTGDDGVVHPFAITSPSPDFLRVNAITPARAPS